MYIHLMAKQYSIADARANLPAIVDEVEAGQEIELTRRGRLVAMMISRQHYERLQSEGPRFKERYHAFLDHYTLSEVGADDDTFGELRERGEARAVEL
ncbi:MAG: type II toxin-antitoxin system prevent-host-death family antitoxin [Actinobacteria bacterium]|nr:type II toxin-antitoxin system prevent-host-death family antitoxin [Actinomycetota bacterium]